MEILSYYAWMESEIEFESLADEESAKEYWIGGRELYVDTYNRVFDDMGVWIANIK